jgi:hypothetical protein
VNETVDANRLAIRWISSCCAITDVNWEPSWIVAE